MRKALADMGEISVIDNGRTALESLLADPHEVLLLDLNLPELKGDELLALLRQTPAMRGLAVILLTAASELDCQARLAKPVDLAELRRQALEPKPD